MEYKRKPIYRKSKEGFKKITLDYGEIEIVKEKALKKTREKIPNSAFKMLGKIKSGDSPFHDQLIKERKKKLEAYKKKGIKIII